MEAVMRKGDSTKVSLVCAVCGNTFLAHVCEIKIGNGKFCSRGCYNKSRTIPLIDRFFRYVGRKLPSGCIPWIGCTNKDGYGVISSGRRDGRMLLANRASYELFVGPIPQGLHVLHSCDNPPCINPVHLFIGTQAINMADKKSKGRMHKRRPGSRRWLQEQRRQQT
jgi:hypothetical protein